MEILRWERKRSLKSWKETRIREAGKGGKKSSLVALHTGERKFMMLAKI